jgi:hypothetical protein
MCRDDHKTVMQPAACKTESAGHITLSNRDTSPQGPRPVSDWV